MTLPAGPDTITIIANHCSAAFKDPMLALAWMRVVIHEFTPDLFVSLVRALNPLDGDAAVRAKHMVDMCFGTGV